MTYDKVRSVALHAIGALAIGCLIVVGPVALSGCTGAQIQTAEQAARTAADDAVKALTIAQAHPELLAAGGAVVNTLAAKVAPEHAPVVALITAHVNAGNATEALTIATDLRARLGQ